MESNYKYRQNYAQSTRFCTKQKNLAEKSALPREMKY